MFITYIVFVSIAILFKIFHLPGASLILLFSIVFPFFDLILQILNTKEDKETRIWSALAIVFWSIFFLFKFLYWPGSTLLFYPAVFFSFIFFIRVFQRKKPIIYRFYLLLIVAVFGIFNYSMTGSNFRMFYMTENPFSTEEQVPHFFRQKLAFSFYIEGEHTKAERLIQLNIKHLERLLVQENYSDFEKDIDEKNLEQSKVDLEMIQRRTWDNFLPLIPEDRAE